MGEGLCFWKTPHPDVTVIVLSDTPTGSGTEHVFVSRLFSSWFHESRPRSARWPVKVTSLSACTDLHCFTPLNTSARSFRGITFVWLVCSRHMTPYFNWCWCLPLGLSPLSWWCPALCRSLFLFVKMSPWMYFISVLFYGTVPAHDAPFSTCEVTAHALLRPSLWFLCGPASADLTDPERQTALFFLPPSDQSAFKFPPDFGLSSCSSPLSSVFLALKTHFLALMLFVCFFSLWSCSEFLFCHILPY